jgi:heterodisulfide reductase subunit B
MATTFKGVKIATHYGCHALRPSQVVGFDNPVAPSLFDQLVEATGAESIEWQMKLECCGAPLWGINDRLSMDLTLKKLNDGKKSGADYVCAACPYCHIQFDKVQKMILSQRNVNHPLPSILYTQLLGLTLGIDRRLLGLEMNEIPISGIEESLKTEAELVAEREMAQQKETKKEKESTKQ